MKSALRILYAALLLLLLIAATCPNRALAAHLSLPPGGAPAYFSLPLGGGLGRGSDQTARAELVLEIGVIDRGGD